MRHALAITIYNGRNIIGFVLQKSYGFEPSLRERIPTRLFSKSFGNKHTLLPTCPSLRLAVDAINRAARNT